MTKYSDNLTIIGHRGSGKGRHPEAGLENSLSSFAHAFDAGADEVECDLAMTRDGEVVIFHDAELRIPGIGKRRIAQLSLAEVLQYAPKTPTIQALVKRFSSKKFLFEFKTYTDFRAIFDQIYEPIVKPHADRYKFISFSIEAVRHVKQTNADVHCAYIATSDRGRLEPIATRKHIRLCLENGVDELSGHWLGIWPGIIREARTAGLDVGLGFVDYRFVLNYCLKHGVNRLYTDNTAKLVTMLRT